MFNRNNPYKGSPLKDLPAARNTQGGNPDRPPFNHEEHAKRIRAMVADLNDAVEAAHRNEMFVLVQIEQPSLATMQPAQIIAVVGALL